MDNEKAPFLTSPTNAFMRWRRNWQLLSPYAWAITVFLLLFNLFGESYHLSHIQTLRSTQPATDLQLTNSAIRNGFWTESKYRGKPNAKLEKDWDELWHIGIVDIPDSRLPLLNKSQEIPWRRTTHGGVAGSLEVFHALHCLDMIRQYTWRNEYDYSSHPTFSENEESIRTHADHCIEALRIRLMCTADVTPYWQRLTSGSAAGAEPDFDTLNKCVDFERLREWARENRAHVAPGQGGSAEEHLH